MSTLIQEPANVTMRQHSWNFCLVLTPVRFYVHYVGASTKLVMRRGLMNELKTNRVVIGREQRSLWENWKRKEAEAGGGWYLRDVDEIPAAFKTIGLRVLFSQVHSICCYCTAEQRQKGCRLGAEPERRSRSVDDTDWSDCWGVGKEMAHIGASRSDRVADAVVQPSRNL